MPNMNLSHLVNQLQKKLANTTFDRFNRIEKRIDELASHFDRIQGHLHVLCEVISSNHMQNDPSMDSEYVACENRLYFDKNDDVIYVSMRKCPFHMIMPLK